MEATPAQYAAGLVAGGRVSFAILFVTTCVKFPKTARETVASEILGIRGVEAPEWIYTKYGIPYPTAPTMAPKTTPFATAAEVETRGKNKPGQGRKAYKESTGRNLSAELAHFVAWLESESSVIKSQGIALKAGIPPADFCKLRKGGDTVLTAFKLDALTTAGKPYGYAPEG